MQKSSTGTKRDRGKLFDSPEQEAYLQLWRTYDRLREIEDELFRGYGINAQQYNALRILKSVRPGAMTTASLAARLVSRSPDMTRMLDKLQANGWVKRARNETNRRVAEVKITPQGVAFLARIAAEVHRCNREQLGHLDRDSLQGLIRLLKAARHPHEGESGQDAWPGSF